MEYLDLWSVEDSRHRQHGDNDEDVSTAAHVTGYNQHLGERRVKRELHHQTSRRSQTTCKYTGRRRRDKMSSIKRAGVTERLCVAVKGGGTADSWE